VGAVDPAFKSRIHLILFYPKLDESRTQKIWKNNLDMVARDYEKEGRKFEFRRDEILKYAKTHFKDLVKKELPVWNGR